ncbi:hypothetical protein [Clostridium vincentii]|uniref:Uncharacterized protein n=1 Tax=Clostridium vincentii TaxID=52704 RepID=A0A2T0B8U6_9CLOT|nr:hypothetical protein [Clostridium vincentii]PRR80294.1 hypothetical protein CLVI_30840 [Clostridium vincentii]
MKYKIRLNLAMVYVFLVYIYYIVKNFTNIAFLGGILFFIAWFCVIDLYYSIEKGNLIAFRIIGSKTFRMRDVVALIDPIPVMHRLNPRPGTLSVYYSGNKNVNKRFNVCPKDQAGFCNAMFLANKKIKIDVKSLKKSK